ncbi:MAG: ribulose-phosphate 3-epimerase [Treponema sp.]|nr:ribulose-phosphate 3-epimerase [Treponema sp.]
MSTPVLSPSLLSADFSDLAGALKVIESAGSGAVHIDVMDGHFVPPITYGQPVIKSIRPRTKLPFDVHLMIENPQSAIDSFIEAGADWITFHYEATAHSDLCIQKIHAAGKKAGVAICPSTPVSVLENVLPLADLILVMTVNPGWGGQALIPYCVDKVCELVSLRKEQDLSFKISVDGGVNQKTVSDVLAAGTDIVVSGSSFFKGELSWKF